MAFCQACGEQLRDGVRFCQRCGVAVRRPPGQAVPDIGGAGRAEETTLEAALSAGAVAGTSAEIPSAGIPSAAPPLERGSSTGGGASAQSLAGDRATHDDAASAGPSRSAAKRRRLTLRWLIVALCLALVAVGAVAAVFLLRGGSMRGLPAETMRAAIGATEADFSAAGTHAGPPGSGETWNVYEAEVSGRGTAWVYLDKDKRVRRVDNFSAAPLQPPESEDKAVTVAGDYLTKVGGPSTDGLTLRPTAGGDSKGRPAAVVWQKRQGRVWVPSGVTVQVARDGTVVGYQWIQVPVTVSLEPKVTAAQAAASVRRDLKLGGIRKKSSVLEVLQIDLESDGTTTQYLVWNLALSLKGYSGPPGALAVVDALTGRVLAAERLVP